MMTKIELNLLKRLFNVILPSDRDSKMDLGAEEARFDNFYADAKEYAPFKFLLAVRFSLWVAIFSPIFLFKAFKLLPFLSEEKQIEVLYNLKESRVFILREAPNVLKTVICLAYCGLPQIRKRMGFTPRQLDPPSWYGGEH